ncbi:MAG TPA: 16S rRNA (cytosine(1402)-N(4))-methyltransferase RsmH [Candidatus Sulfomarinibacteraceae bacterium]|nr:16S rRNA (cytosine(1402)-N(4))-methyltransferase RsmH [Candidatus Sulfomarinibacteraceae bacterium]
MDEHIPVLYDDVMRLLQPQPGGQYIDGTLGGGGHTAGILERSAPDGRVLAFDRDPDAIAFARQRLAQYGERVTFVQGSYAEMETVAPAHSFSAVDGVLLDLGLSSRQLADEERGFSFMREGPLDMRFDPTQGETAADLVNNLTAGALADIFWRYGEEQNSRRYARAIVEARPLQTTTELAEVIEQAAPHWVRRKRIHPATLVFQALRIAVNQELMALEKGLQAAIELLRPGGRVAVISFHSLEDRFVKNLFRDLTRDCICPPRQPICTCDVEPRLRLVTRKVVMAGDAEIEENPRSRSARLRVAQKL